MKAARAVRADKTKPSSCDCLKKTNELLATKNTRVRVFFSFRTGRFYIPIETELIAKGKRGEKAVALVASFCPFCGAKLVFREDPEAL
jgi:hypothetical protein